MGFGRIATGLSQATNSKLSGKASCWIDGGGLPHFHGLGGVGVGWMITFFGLANMLDATEMLTFFGFVHMLDAIRNCSRSLGLQACWMLRMIRFVVTSSCKWKSETLII